MQIIDYQSGKYARRPFGVECYLLVYPCSQYPPLYGFVGTRWGIYVPEYAFIRLAPLAHEFSAACGVILRYSSPPVFFCLKMIWVATGTQLVEIGNLAVPGERSVLDPFPAVLRPRTRLVFEVVFESQDKLPVNIFPFERFQFRLVFEQVFQAGVPVSPIPHALALEPFFAIAT